MCPDYYASRLDLFMLFLKLKQIREMENRIHWSLMNWFGKIKVMNWTDGHVEGIADYETE